MIFKPFAVWRQFIVLSCVLCLPVSIAVAQKKGERDIPMAPLPIQIRTATKVFLVNGGGYDPGFDIFYADMKDWAKYQLVQSPDEAELVMEFACRSEDGGTRVWSTTNTWTKATQVHSGQITYYRLVFTVYDRKSNIALWTTQFYPGGAWRKKNRVKEWSKAAHALVVTLRKRMTIED